MNEGSKGPQEILEQTSIVARFVNVEPRQFREELDKIWKFGEQVTDLIASGVEAETITPVQGVKVASCLAGTLLGYEEFHPNGAASPANTALTNVLMSRISDTQAREHELAGASR